MSCKACEEVQQLGEMVFYYRWKNANLAVMGCREHVREMFEALNEVQVPGKPKAPAPPIKP